MENYYNTLAKMPALKAKHMPPGLEGLAQALVNSGRFRVDTITEQNFVRWGRPFENVNMIFSHREIFDKDIIPRTTETMTKVFSRKHSGDNLKKKVEEELKRLQGDSKRNIEVDLETELALARLIVQSAEPAVILLLIAEGAEVFVTYSYNVGDMLDIQTWQEAGDSSGLQSTEHTGYAVFVSCGGNPLIPEKKVEHPTDGLHAKTRMVVIAGQELAHYSDIRREGLYRGSRYSTDSRYRRPSEAARVGRLNDMANTRHIHKKIETLGLKLVAESERALKFYREHRKWSLTVLFNKIKVFLYQCGFILLCKIRGFYFLKPYFKDEYTCSKITLMLTDMLFNLQPEADAYKRHDPLEEEMVMCIEALARVQQQANKWGREVTKIMYPSLYKIYYYEIIPACIRHYENISGNKFPDIFKRKY